MTQTQIYQKYPHGLGDDELNSAVKQYADAIFQQKGEINTVLRFSPLIQIGISEIQARQVLKVMKRSLAIGFVSFVISVLAITMVIASLRSSVRWEKNQLRLLESLVSTVESTTDDITKGDYQRTQVLEKIRGKLSELTQKVDATNARLDELLSIEREK